MKRNRREIQEATLDLVDAISRTTLNTMNRLDQIIELLDTLPLRTKSETQSRREGFNEGLNAALGIFANHDIHRDQYGRFCGLCSARIAELIRGEDAEGGAVLSTQRRATAPTREGTGDS